MPLPRCAESESAAGRGAQVSGARLSPLLSLPLLSPRRRADPDQSRSVTPPRRAPLGEKVGRGEVASRRATRGRADRSLAFARREGIDAREKMSGEKRAPKRSGRTGASALRLRGAPRVAAYFDFRTAKGGGGGWPSRQRALSRRAPQGARGRVPAPARASPPPTLLPRETFAPPPRAQSSARPAAPCLTSVHPARLGPAGPGATSAARSGSPSGAGARKQRPPSGATPLRRDAVNGARADPRA